MDYWKRQQDEEVPRFWKIRMYEVDHDGRSDASRKIDEIDLFRYPGDDEVEGLLEEWCKKTGTRRGEFHHGVTEVNIDDEYVRYPITDNSVTISVFCPGCKCWLTNRSVLEDHGCRFLRRKLDEVATVLAKDGMRKRMKKFLGKVRSRLSRLLKRKKHARLTEDQYGSLLNSMFGHDGRNAGMAGCLFGIQEDLVSQNPRKYGRFEHEVNSVVLERESKTTLMDASAGPTRRGKDDSGGLEALRVLIDSMDCKNGRPGDPFDDCSEG